MKKCFWMAVVAVMAMAWGIAWAQESAQMTTEGAEKRGLVLHYSFEMGGKWGPGEVVKDLSGRGHDGRVVGDGLEVVRGMEKKKKAVRFDGKGDYIRVPRDAELEPEEITVAAWVKVREGDDQNGEAGVLVFKRNSSFHYNENYCVVIYPSRVIRTSIGYPPSFQTRVDSSVSLVPESWHHVAMTFRAGDVRLYVDGKLAGSGTFDHKLNSNSGADLLIGMRDHAEYPPGQFGEYELAELKIWNEALDGERVAALYQEKAALVEGVAETTGTTKKRGVVLDYSFERGGKWGAGSVVKDLSGRGHDGRVVGDGLKVVRGIGKRKKAVRFDGKGDYIRVPRNEALEPEELTVAAWVKVRKGDDQHGDAGVLVFKRNSSFHDNENYCVEFYPNRVVRTSLGYPPSFQTRVNSSIPLVPELWHHVATTFRDGEVRVYVDGEMTGIGRFEHRLNSNPAADLLIGMRDHAAYPPGRFGEFELAELKIWDEALDGEQVGALYRARAGSEGVAKPEDNRAPGEERPVGGPPCVNVPGCGGVLPGGDSGRVFTKWEPVTGKVGGEARMAAELKALVAQGRRDRAASPEFLAALEGLAEKWERDRRVATDKLPNSDDVQGDGGEARGKMAATAD